MFFNPSRQVDPLFCSIAGSVASRFPQLSPTRVHLHRIADADHAAIDIDLNAPRLAFLREKFGIGKARSDHQKRIAFHHHVVAGFGAQQADRARDIWQVVGNSSLA